MSVHRTDSLTHLNCNRLILLQRINLPHWIQCMRYACHWVLPYRCSLCSSSSTRCSCSSLCAQPVSVTPFILRLFLICFLYSFAVIATVALAFLLLPMCQYIIRPCTDGKRFSFGICGRFTAAELFSFTLSVSIVCVWVLTGHWLLMDG